MAAMGTDRPKVGVYGLGRFGAFWGSLLSGRMEVIGASRSWKEDLPAGIAQVEPQGLEEAEAVFLCVAISAMEESCRLLARILPPTVPILDTCSVKVHPASVMERHFGDSRALIATHPMFGPDSGREGVEGLPIITHPIRDRDGTYELWGQRFRSLGLRIVEMSPEDHDREAAYTQGITHFVGRVLSRLDLPHSAIATLGYRKIQEVIEQTCNDPYQLFLDLQHYNPYTSSMRGELTEALEETLRELTSFKPRE